MSTTADVHVADIPALLAERGVVVGYRLVVSTPKGAVDDDLKRLLARHKPTLVEALARADAYGNPSVTYADVLTWGDQGFDWASGEQRRVPGGDDDLAEFKATLDALTTEGEKFTEVDADDFDRRFKRLGVPDDGRKPRWPKT